MSQENNEKHNAIEKALYILSFFTPNNEEMGTLEISQKLGYNKATVSRTLLLLARHGYLDQNRQNKKFRLGPASLAIGMAVNRSLKKDLVSIAKPYVDKLSEELDASVVLEVLYGKKTIMAYVAEGPRRIRLAGEVGDSLPFHVSAGGKSILAFSSKELRDHLLDKELIQLTKYSITDRSVFEEQLREIRQDGVAFDLMEQDLDVSAAGAPILDTENQPVGAIIVVGLATRIKKDINSIIAVKVKEAAMNISRRFYASLHKNDF